MKDKTKNKIKLRLLKALRNGYVNYEKLLNVLTFKTKGQLTIFIEAVNELYQEDLIMPVSVGQEKGLILCKK